MFWKVVVVTILNLQLSIYAYPGIRTPPEVLHDGTFKQQSETPNPTISSVSTHTGGEIPLVTNRRYLEKVVDVMPSMLVDINLNPISEFGIFPEYKTSSNFVVNEFLKKNIDHLLNDRLPRNHIKSNGSQLNDIKSSVRSYSGTYDVPTKNSKKNDKHIRKGSINNLKNSVPIQVISSDEYNKLQNIRIQNQVPLVVVTSRPPITKFSSSPVSFGVHKVPQYYSTIGPTRPPLITNWYHSTEPTNLHVSSIIPSYQNYPYDPADPDPFYDLISDTPSVSDGYGSISQDSAGDEKSELPPIDKIDPKCPGVKVTLNDKVSLNIQQNSQECNGVQFNVTSDNKNEATTLKSIQSDVTSLEKKKPTSTGSVAPILHSGPTQLIPLIAEIPANSGTHTAGSHTSISSGTSAANHIPSILTGGAGGGHGGGHGSGHQKKKHKRKNKNKHKHEEQNPMSTFTFALALKYIAFLFTKLFAIFSIANPLTFSFWIMMFSPLAVLLAGATGLAVIIYPFASAALSHAFKSGKQSPSTVVIHRHRHVSAPKFKKPIRPIGRPLRPIKPWGHYKSWKRIDEKDNKELVMESRSFIPINEAHLDDIQGIVESSIKNFLHRKNS